MNPWREPPEAKRRLAANEEIRVGDLYGDETDEREEPGTKPKKIAGGQK